MQLLSSVFSGFSENSCSIYSSFCSTIRDFAFDANSWPDWMKRGWDALQTPQAQREDTSSIGSVNGPFDSFIQRALELVANGYFDSNFIDNALTCAAFCIVGCLFGGWIGLFFGAILGAFISHGMSYFPDCKRLLDFIFKNQCPNSSL